MCSHLGCLRRGGSSLINLLAPAKQLESEAAHHPCGPFHECRHLEALIKPLILMPDDEASLQSTQDYVEQDVIAYIRLHSRHVYSPQSIFCTEQTNVSPDSKDCLAGQTAARSSPATVS